MKPPPFQESKKLTRRVKMLCWGASGVGKTRTALQFPKPVVIDMEGGTDLYGDSFDFLVKRTTNPDEVMDAVSWLLTNAHPYKTLVIDPITIYWDALQRKWSDIFLRRNTSSKGHHHEFYDFQPRDWMTIKSELKELIRKLLALDMNVIVTAREKVMYAEGAFMRAVGETFDGEKSLPYIFDYVVRLYRSPDGRYMAKTIKDRSGTLPAEFENTNGTFVELLGKEELYRDARPVLLATDEQVREIQTLIKESQLSPEKVQRRLAAYNAESLVHLTKENACVVLERLQEAKLKRKDVE